MRIILKVAKMSVFVTKFLIGQFIYFKQYQNMRAVDFETTFDYLVSA